MLLILNSTFSAVDVAIATFFVLAATIIEASTPRLQRAAVALHATALAAELCILAIDSIYTVNLRRARADHTAGEHATRWELAFIGISVLFTLSSFGTNAVGIQRVVTLWSHAYSAAAAQARGALAAAATQAASAREALSSAAASLPPPPPLEWHLSAVLSKSLSRRLLGSLDTDPGNAIGAAPSSVDSRARTRSDAERRSSVSPIRWCSSLRFGSNLVAPSDSAGHEAAPRLVDKVASGLVVPEEAPAYTPVTTPDCVLPPFPGVSRPALRPPAADRGGSGGLGVNSGAAALDGTAAPDAAP